MHYWSQYDESDEDGDHLSQAINNGLMAVNQTHVFDFRLSSFLSPNSVYGDSPFYEARDAMWRGTDFGSSSPPPFLDDDLEERVLQDILDLQDDYLNNVQHDIPSPLPDLIPTPVNDVNDVESDVFLSSSGLPLPPLPAAESAVHQNPNTGGVRRRRQRQKQLWQFLLEILCDEQHKDIISWVHRDEGVFRFVKPKSVAALWGKRRRREHMTYEHLSRAMRYYYKRDVMKRVVNLGRLNYQFRPNAEGWRDYSRRA